MSALVKRHNGAQQCFVGAHRHIMMQKGLPARADDMPNDGWGRCA